MSACECAVVTGQLRCPGEPGAVLFSADIQTALLVLRLLAWCSVMRKLGLKGSGKMGVHIYFGQHCIFEKIPQYNDFCILSD